MMLTALPEEILELIVNKLTVKELLACSCVSVNWREKFNVDAYWKRFCAKEISNYLENNDCTVEPNFCLPEDKEERLQPLCDWRINYMRNVHLLNNWKLGRFSSNEFRPYEGVISCDIKVDGDGVHWLFVRTEINIEVWNIKSIPQLCITIPVFLECPVFDIFIVGKKVVVSQWDILSVYCLEVVSNNPLYRFKLEDDQHLPEILWGSTNKDNVEGVNLEDDFGFNIFGTLLVGYKRIPNTLYPYMHFWDIIKGKKIKIESMLNFLEINNEINFTNIFPIDSTNGLVRLVYKSFENELYSQLFAYDFKNLRYTKSNISVPGVVVWCGWSQNITVTFSSHPGGVVQFFDYFSEKLLSVKDIGEYTTSAQIHVIDSYFMYCMFNCMNVMNIHTQEVIYCLEFSFHSFVRRLTLIEPRFVVVWLLERGGSPGCPSYSQEVWDMRDLSYKLLQCSSELGSDMVCSSRSIIKQVISTNGMMHIYNFW